VNGARTGDRAVFGAKRLRGPLGTGRVALRDAHLIPGG
jgi:hypothetical protein